MNRRTLIKAIAERRLLEIRYQDQTRVVEPHTLFEDRAGDLILNCWQVRGFSETDKPPWWRSLAVSNMESAKMLAETFVGPRPGYEAQSSQFARIIAEL